MPEPSTNPAEPEAPAPAVVGNTFMRQYYQFLAKDPSSLHRFYKDESTFCHGDGSRMETPISGQRAIHDAIRQRGYEGARVDLDPGSLDCQRSQDGGVLVLVTGVMTLPAYSPTPRPFVQTFFLAVQPKGYFVLNDCLRFLDFPGASPTEAASPSPVTSPVAHVAVQASAPSKESLSEQPKASESSEPSPTPEPAVVEEAPASPEPKKEPEVKDDVPEETVPAEEATQKTSGWGDVEASASEPQAPAVPKTWAALFASKSSANANASPAAPPASAPTPAAATSANAPAPAPAPAKKAALAAKAVAPEAATQRERPRYHSLFIRDVPADAKESELKELFAPFGNVASVNILANRGSAFVDYHEQEPIRSVLSSGQEFRLHDKILLVDERKDRNNLPNNRGRGRGGFKPGRSGRDQSTVNSRGRGGRRGGRGDAGRTD